MRYINLLSNDFGNNIVSSVCSIESVLVYETLHIYFDNPSPHPHAKTLNNHTTKPQQLLWKESFGLFQC